MLTYPSTRMAELQRIAETALYHISPEFQREYSAAGRAAYDLVGGRSNEKWTKSERTALEAAISAYEAIDTAIASQQERAG